MFKENNKEEIPILKLDYHWMLVLGKCYKQGNMAILKNMLGSFMHNLFQSIYIFFRDEVVFSTIDVKVGLTSFKNYHDI